MFRLACSNSSLNLMQWKIWTCHNSLHSVWKHLKVYISTLLCCLLLLFAVLSLFFHSIVTISWLPLLLSCWNHSLGRGCVGSLGEFCILQLAEVFQEICQISNLTPLPGTALVRMLVMITCTVSVIRLLFQQRLKTDEANLSCRGHHKGCKKKWWAGVVLIFSPHAQLFSFLVK